MDLERLAGWWRAHRSPTDECDTSSEQQPVNTAHDLRIVRLVMQRGGRTTRRALVDCLPLEAETVERELDDLEADGVIVQHHTGRHTNIELNDDPEAVDALARRGDRDDA